MTGRHMQERNEDGLRSASFWREKAEEARTLAEGMTDPEAEATMRNIAVMYESMANRAEEREKSKPRPST